MLLKKVEHPWHCHSQRECHSVRGLIVAAEAEQPDPVVDHLDELRVMMAYAGV